MALLFLGSVAGQDTEAVWQDKVTVERQEMLSCAGLVDVETADPPRLCPPSLTLSPGRPPRCTLRARC